jgi:hypothetical protein
MKSCKSMIEYEESGRNGCVKMRSLDSASCVNKLGRLEKSAGGASRERVRRRTKDTREEMIVFVYTDGVTGEAGGSRMRCGEIPKKQRFMMVLRCAQHVL